jgi:hypothetical protein
MHIDKDVDWNGTLLKQDYDICNYDWAPLKKNFIDKTLWNTTLRSANTSTFQICVPSQNMVHIN